MRSVTWRAATAVTAHVKHQPLQWNIGTVQRNALSGVSPATMTSERAFRYAPRCVKTTPLGVPVVPEV